MDKETELIKEILKASEDAANSIRKMQESLGITYKRAGEKVDDLATEIEKYLVKRHITGNLDMFDDNRTLTLEREFVSKTGISLSSTSV